MPAQQGFALVIVIWVLTLMTIMAGSFALTMRREIALIETVKNNAATQALAETGLAIAQQMLLLSDENERWRADGSIYQLEFLNAEIRVRLLSEEGKVDINKADETQLMELTNQLPIGLENQQALVSAILDWRDNDDLVRINGAEDKEYKEAGLAYHPANRDFQLVDELQMVLGMNAESFKTLRPLITVYSGANKVDVNVAPKEVLQVLSHLEPEVLEDYLRQRTENNIAKLPPPLYPGENEGGSASESGGGGSVYTVVSQAKLHDEVGSGLVVTYRSAGQAGSSDAFKVLDWQESHYNESLFSDEMTQYLITEQNESER